MPTSRNDLLTVKPAFLILTAVLLLLLPLSWVSAWFLAAFVHEVFHYIALKLFGVQVNCISVDISGAVMETGPLSNMQEIICSLAGPVGGLSLLLVSKWFPYLSICAFLQSAYNLLPVFPLDGGRALRCLMEWLVNKNHAAVFCAVIEKTIFTVLFLLSCIALFRFGLGPIPLISTAVLFIKNRPIKFPCKRRQQIVQ